MLHFLPHYSEILVSPMTCEEVVRRLESVTRNVDFLSYQSSQSRENIQFNGTINKDAFRMSVVVTHADSFLPLIKGKIDPTPNGCIIFLDFSLFPGAGFFLVFWSVVTLLMGLFFLVAANEPWFALVSVLVGMGNMVFTWKHFRRKVQYSQKILHKMLDLQKRE